MDKQLDAGGTPMLFMGPYWLTKIKLTLPVIFNFPFIAFLSLEYTCSTVHRRIQISLRVLRDGSTVGRQGKLW